MIECTCINDKNRPPQFSQESWVVKGEVYHITYVTHLLPQNVLGLSLYEKPISPECAPYEYFLSDRFAFTWENFMALIEMFTDIGQISTKDMVKLINKTQFKKPTRELV